jgi:N-formylglutamate deformylase
VLFDGHSIKSELPWLFDGVLPHMNLGTVGRAAAARRRCARGGRRAGRAVRYTHVVDGRFKGGHITRSYGRPADGVHAVQLEMCWRAYMDEGPPYAWHDARALAVTPLLRAWCTTMLEWRP